VVKTKPLVLIVDDDPDLRVLANLQLGTSFDVVQAATGEECLEMAHKHKPDVILLDMMMPGMSGGEVLQALSDDPATKDIPVIFLSALAEQDVRLKAIDEGALDYVTKPANWRELTARVGAAARVKKRHEEIRAGLSTDPVTGLQLRVPFENRLREEIARSIRSNAPLCILLISLDDHESFSLRFGEDDADSLIHDVANVLRASLRTSDAIYRYETNEFAAILPDTDISTGYLAAERLRDGVHEARRNEKPPSISVGISEFTHGSTVSDLVAKAEVALFRAQESGGDLAWRADDPRKRSLNPVALSEELTDREWDVLTFLVQRNTEHEIARKLGISPGTVRSHKARIRRKLHVSPDVRLSDFARTNLGNLGDRLTRPRAGDGHK
jgi:diguanylate cyclase (GGDEF)-like protein